jgi:hypothetical protein
MVGYTQNFADAKVYKWNGSTLDTLPLPSFSPRILVATDFWGVAASDAYIVGSLADPSNPDIDQGLIMHYDGTSWARIQTPVDSSRFQTIHGSSSCDVMATGYAHASSQTQGTTFQRNGSSWETKKYADLLSVTSVTKQSPFKYLLFGQTGDTPDPFTKGRVGTDNGDFTVTWVKPITDFEGGFVTWKIPGTNTYRVGGNWPGWILKSTCQ